jgi:formate dehydrogenase major subunit
MKVSRRDFLKILGATTAGGLGGILGFSADPALARVRDLKITKAKVGKAICTYCSVLCGLLIYWE